MAQWKKLLTSGSSISQLNNDSGYLTTVTAQPTFVSASVQGTVLIANNSQGTLSFVTGSSYTGLTLSGSAGNDTVTLSLSSIPNTALANDGITIAGVDTSLGGTITAATIGTAGGFISGSSQIDHDQTTNFASNEHFTQANITTVGTVTSGNVTAILPTGTVSGSAQVNADSITNFDANVKTKLNAESVISGSTFSSPSQGTVRATINGANTDVDTGLQTGDSPQFTNLTLSGNLTVEGDTINANVTNLDIEDRYILLNSGSSTVGDSGIIFGAANGAAQTGTALVWDASYNGNDGRLSIVNTLASGATGNTTPNYSIAGVFEGNVANAATAQADHAGNIRIESNEIYIYV